MPKRDSTGVCLLFRSIAYSCESRLYADSSEVADDLHRRLTGSVADTGEYMRVE